MLATALLREQASRCSSHRRWGAPHGTSFQPRTSGTSRSQLALVTALNRATSLPSARELHRHRYLILAVPL